MRCRPGKQIGEERGLHFVASGWIGVGVSKMKARGGMKAEEKRKNMWVMQGQGQLKATRVHLCLLVGVQD